MRVATRTFVPIFPAFTPKQAQSSAVLRPAVARYAMQNTTALAAAPSAGTARFSAPSLRLSRPFASSAANLANTVKGFNVGRLNHVAIVVPDLDASAAMYRDVLGAEVSAPQDLPEHGVTVVFVLLGNTKFELLQVLGENSPVANFLKKNPAGGIHHVCLEVADIHEGVRVMKENGVKVLNEEPKIGAHGKPVVFLHPKNMNGVLVELEQC